LSRNRGSLITIAATFKPATLFVETTMKKSLKVIAASLALIATQASASPINVGGVVWDPDSFFDFRTGDTMLESIVATPGDTLNGYGKITALNLETNQSVFCPGCEITYTFTYTLASVSPTLFTFSGGSLKVYVDHTPDFNPLLASTAGAAGGGVLFLDLVGHSHIDVATLAGPATLFSTPTPAVTEVFGNGRGFFDVVGGLAAGNFDTNTRSTLQPLGLGAADFTFSSSFQLLESTFVSDDGKRYGMFGTNDLRGNSIPEPGTMALFGMGMLGLAALRRRKTA
jgi:hypothetical protein